MCGMTHSHVWHDSCICVAWPRYLFVMSHIWRSHVTHMNESCHTWLSHVTHFCATLQVTRSRHISNVWRDSFPWATRRIPTCTMTHSYVWHDSFTCVTRLEARLLERAYASFIYATWLIYMCGMTHLYVWHDSFICVTWLTYMCDMTRLYVWHDSHICALWLVWHDSFLYAPWLICVPGPWPIHVCSMTH